jgi:SAM-dependent methyltransferase
MIARTTEITIKLTPFDQREYRKLIEARGETIRQVVARLRHALDLSNALDAGCGVGFFSQTLEECGLNACGFDGRAENVDEARNRFPQIPFAQGNIEDQTILELGRFDLVVCFGLLYHLENPLRAIRNLRGLTEKCLLLESMCVPEEKSSLLLREEPEQGDQSLTSKACYPTEGSMVKMLYRAGFAAVYRVARLPDHDDFRETTEHVQRRTVLLASSAPIDIAGFRLLSEPQETVFSGRGKGGHQGKRFSRNFGARGVLKKPASAAILGKGSGPLVPDIHQSRNASCVVSSSLRKKREAPIRKNESTCHRKQRVNRFGSGGTF